VKNILLYALRVSFMLSIMLSSSYYYSMETVETGPVDGCKHLSLFKCFPFTASFV
jgi:hypothetical protein